MLVAHRILAIVVIVVSLGASVWGGLVYWRGRGAGELTAHLLTLAQTLLVAQVSLGLLLLSGGYRAADRLHYAYGSLSLGAALAPWFYAPASGPKRLLWFAGMLALAAVLAVRAFMVAV